MAAPALLLLAGLPFTMALGNVDTGITLSKLNVKGNDSFLAVNSTLSISAVISNRGGHQQPCFVIFEVRDSKGITQYLELGMGNVGPNGQTVFSLSWKPDMEGIYRLNAFAINNLAEPLVLTDVESIGFEVAGREDMTGMITLPGSTTVSSISSQLKQYALEQINQDREKFGLPPVLLSTNGAAQVHAEDVLTTRQLSHWMTNGEKPYMTYTRYGGLGHVAQNVAFSGYGDNYEKCVSKVLLCEKTNPYEEIERQENAMVYNDTECCDDGHRDNILNKYHTHVSIGIAYDTYNFVMVQNFEDNYIKSDGDGVPSIGHQGTEVKIHGVLQKGSIYTINVLYDKPPTYSVYQQNKDKNYYDGGSLAALVVEPAPPGYYYDEPNGYSLVEARAWTVDGQSVDVAFDLASVMKKEGVYTVYVYVKDGSGSGNNDGFPVTSYSIFNS